jgi:DUF438 domain-containing protein
VAHGQIDLEHGTLSPQQLVAVFSAIPADVTFIDAEGVVRYFSAYRIFSRPESCLNQHVLECHSASSRPGIERMLSEFASGWRDDAYFLSDKDGVPVHTRYVAVRADSGEYLGCLEVAQWVEPEVG